MRVYLFFLILLFLIPVYGQNQNEFEAFMLFKKGNEAYKIKNYEEAKNYYLEVIKNYPKYRFRPEILYILSHLDNNVINIITYLSEIKNDYPDFRYWTNAVEKLGEIYYILGNYNDAVLEFNKINSDKAYYMLGLIYSANGFENLAIESISKMIKLTKDRGLIYKGYLILLKIYLEKKYFDEVDKILKISVKLKRWAYDNGARFLYYAGKYYFLRTNIENNFQKSYYIFLLLKKLYPYSVEATMADNFISYIKKNNIENFIIVPWIYNEFEKPIDFVFKDEKLTMIQENEEKIEKINKEAESLYGNAIQSQVLEYIVSVGEYNDLSVANLVISDLSKLGYENKFGIYYRKGKYIPEMRGIKNKDEAVKIGEKLLQLGYTETKVREIIKLIEYRE